MKKLYHICTIGLILVVVGCDHRPMLDRSLCDALRSDDTNYIGQFLEKGGDPNRSVQFMPFGKITAPLLDIAVKYGQQDTLSLLLKNGADPNRPDWNGTTPLMWSVKQGPAANRVEMTQALLAAGADPNKPALGSGDTVLIDAAELGETNELKLLLASGANVKTVNRDGFSALHLAYNAEVAHILITAGADTEAKTIEGETPADVARRQGRLDVLKLLTEPSSKSNANKSGTSR